MKELPMIACSLDGDELGARKDEFRSLFDDALTGTERTDEGIRLRFASGAGARVRELVAKESQCCPFFGFLITEDDDGTTLDIAAPPDARPLLDEMIAGRAT